MRSCFICPAAPSACLSNSPTGLAGTATPLFHTARLISLRVMGPRMNEYRMLTNQGRSLPIVAESAG